MGSQRVNSVPAPGRSRHFERRTTMDFRRAAAATLTIVFTLVISQRSAVASEETDVVAAVHRYFDNLDQDKLKTALTMCDSHVSILDEFPPHEWHGPTACGDWWKALNAYDKKKGLRTGPLRWARPGPSMSPEIAHILWLQRPTSTSNMGKPLRNPTRFLR
jgi:hypothetical protein